MNILLWILQILLALVFAYHGRLLIRAPAELMSEQMNYIYELQSPFGRILGVLEILAGIGLILPELTNIVPALTPLAAIGLVIVMVFAIIYHYKRHEYPNIVFNLVLLAMAAFVAYGRLTPVS